MGAASHRPNARSLRPNATQAIGPNPMPTEGGEVLQEEEVTGEEEEEGNLEEGNEEDETVSNDDMEYSVILVAPGQPIVGITAMYRVFIILD